MKQPLLIVLLAFLLAASSCVSVKPIEYLQSTQDTTVIDRLAYREAIIEPGDMISISVVSENPTASAIYNPGGGNISPNMPAGGSGGTSSNGGSTQVGAGYLVNQDGYVIMPGLGLVRVAGFTEKKLADSLVNYFTTNNLLKSPAVDIRFLNYKITVLGEVQRPGQYVIPSDKVNILEALGLAGDFTIWAKRENVTVIRDENGKRVLGRIDITSPDVFTSPYYYLKQNDIVMVDQVKRKARATDATTLRYVAITTSVVSAAAILINLFRN